MAGGSLLTLLDDIAALLDDVALMTKLAAKKTAGVMGDDLAVNAEQVQGLSAARELPVVWAVAKGSLVNKVILVPLALVISALAPWAVMPLMILGGAFLCYEGVEKIIHSIQHARATPADDAPLLMPGQSLAALERDKIKGAVRTDFILSAEIIVLTLGVVADADLVLKALTLTVVALLMTVGVYGLVAAIVKIDDLGLYLARRQGVARGVGRGLLVLAPRLMKLLSVAGTVAMLLVGGGILLHGWHAAEHTLAGLLSGLWQPLQATAANLIAGCAMGLLAYISVEIFSKFIRRFRNDHGAGPPAGPVLGEHT